MARKRTRLTFAGGVIKDTSALAAEGAFTASQGMRGVRPAPNAPTFLQSMGGYEAVYNTPHTGIARGCKTWTDRTGTPLVAFGTAETVYALVGGAELDISRNWGEFFLTNPFTTETGTPTITYVHNVYDPTLNQSTITPHGMAVGDEFSVDHPVTFNGVTLTGTYAVVSVVSETSFTFTHGSNASGTGTMSGDKVWITFAWKAGLVNGLGGLGFGTGAYSVGPYSQPSISDYQPRIWFLDNLADRLMAVPSGGPLFEFQAEMDYPELIYNGTFTGSATGWALGTGWSYSANTLTASAGTGSNGSQAISDRVEGGRAYRLTFTVTRSAGSVYVGVNAGDPAAVVRLSPDIAQGGTYTMLLVMPAQPVDLVFAKDASFAGTIDNVELAKESKLFRIAEAPLASDMMFIDARGQIVLAGTYTVAGVYNPLAVRASDRANNRSWVPDSSNLAYETILAKGGRCVGGLSGRNQNHIWTDDAIYYMRPTGTNGSPFQTDIIGSGCGLIAPLAAAEQGGFIFWMSNSKQFFATEYDFQGAVPRPIECPSLDYVFDSLTPAQSFKIWCWVNIKHNEIHWQYPSDIVGNELEPDADIFYNITTKEWWTNESARTAGSKAGVYPDPILISHYDDGGTEKGKLYFHERGTTAEGNSLSCSATTAPIDMADGDTFALVRGLSIDMKEQLGSMNVTIYAQNEPRGQTRTFGPYVVSTTTERLNFRIMARRMWFKFDAESTPMSVKFGALDFDIAPTGVAR